MDEKSILAKVADAITSKPVVITVTLKNINWFDRLMIRIGIKKTEHVFNITPLLVGNRYRISGRAAKIPHSIMQSGVLEAMLNPDYVKDYIYCVAIGIQNNRHEPSQHLLRLIEFQFDDKDLAAVLTVIFNSIPLNDFIKSTVLLKGADVLSVPEKVA